LPTAPIDIAKVRSLTERVRNERVPENRELVLRYNSYLPCDLKMTNSASYYGIFLIQ